MSRSCKTHFHSSDPGDKPHLNTATHRLTDLLGEKHPFICQKCGGTDGRHNQFLPDQQSRILRHSVSRWQEHDHHDHPEQRLIVLCDKCAKEIIKPHPRLYSELQTNQPWPGCMEICVGCKHRVGVSCPLAKANGGPGVVIMITQPTNAMIDGAKYRGPIQLWSAPAHDCQQREVDKEKVLDAVFTPLGGESKLAGFDVAPPIEQEGKSLWLVCGSCKARQMLASGSTAKTMTRDRARQLAGRAGWNFDRGECSACDGANQDKEREAE